MPVSPNGTKPTINEELVAKTMAEIDRVLTDEPMSPQEAGARAPKRMNSHGWYLRLEVRVGGELTIADTSYINAQYIAAGWRTCLVSPRSDEDGPYAVVKLTEYKSYQQAEPVDVDEPEDDHIDEEE